MSSLPVFLRPATKFQEIDLTQRINVILSTIGSLVGEFDRGPVTPTYQSGFDEDFRKLYGRIANPSLSFAHDTATTFMTQSGDLLINRVTKNAKYAGISVFYDSIGARALLLPFQTGSDAGYSEGMLAAATVNIAGTYITAGTFKMDITDGDTLVSTATVTYATSHNQTLTNIAAAIQTSLNTFGVGATARVYNEPTGGNNKIIVIRVPKTLSLDFSNIVVGGSGITATLNESPKMFDVYAENPGDWANDYGIKISNIDTGTRERYNLTLSGALVTSNSVAVTVNGTLVTQAFATDSDTTLANLATALEALSFIDEAIVQEVPGGADNDRTILVVATEPGANKLDFFTVTPVITGGASQAVLVPSKVMTGIAADGTFTLQVFSRSNTNQAEENFLVALNQQVDSRGYQLSIANKVNVTSGKSINIRVVTPVNQPYTMYDANFDPIVFPTTVAWLAGGDNGVKVTSAEVRAGWRDMDDRVQFPYSVMLNAGYTSVAVQKEMAAIAEERSDCIAILDAPSDKQEAQVLRQYRLDELDLDTTFAAMYTPDVEIEDDQTGERRFIPPSGPIGATYAYSDRLSNGLGAPAGLNRGKIQLAVGLRYRYTPAQQDLIYPSPIGINFIIHKPSVGPVVMAEQTLQVKTTVLSSVHARRILNLIKTGIVDGLDYVLFEPNSEATRFNAVQLGKTILDPLTDPKGNKGLYRNDIKCDDDNNPPEVIDADQLAYDIYLQITRVIKGILVRGVLTRTGASFQEIVLP